MIESSVDWFLDESTTFNNTKEEKGKGDFHPTLIQIRNFTSQIVRKEDFFTLRKNATKFQKMYVCHMDTAVSFQTALPFRKNFREK